jgi:NosR/NirI family transcriptional regulator, nitrous oxide reductase regulator
VTCQVQAARFRGGICAVLVLLTCLLLTTLAQAQAPVGWNFPDADEVQPTALELVRAQAADLGLFAAFVVLAMVSFVRKGTSLKYLTLIVCVLYMGFAKSQLLSIVNLFGVLSGNLPIFAHNLVWYAFALFTIVSTILWGRLYCGRFCAFGALTQLLDALVPARLRVNIPAALERRANYVKYGILGAALGWFLLTHQIGFYRYIEPFWMFTRHASTALWIALGALLLASVFVRNLYCRFFCPLGAALGLLSNLTVFEIKRWPECGQCRLCERTCEWGAIQQRKIIKRECVRCDDCEILYEDKARCPHWLLIAKRARLMAQRAFSRGGQALP